MRFLRLGVMAAALRASCLCHGQEQVDPSVPCIRKLGDDPRFNLIAAKLPLAGADKMTLQMLADQTKPTDEERKQISAYVLAKNECGAMGEQFRGANYPVEANAAIADAVDKGLAAMADLYDRKLTYGEANKQTQAIISEMRNKIASVVQRIQDERAARQDAANRQADEQRAARQNLERSIDAQQAAAQAQANERRRQALIQYFLTRPPPGQLPMPQPPIQTNCLAYANSVNCTTH